MARLRQYSSGRWLQKLDQRVFVGTFGNGNVTGGGKRFGDMGGKAKMPHRQRRARDPGLLGAR